MRFTALLLIGTSMAAVASQAGAQTQQETSAQAANPPSSATPMPRNVMEGEIIVTATKRASTVQDVPFSVNAHTQEDIRRANAKTLENYLAGYIESLRWVVDKNNRDEAIALLMDKRKLTRSLATRSYDLMIEPGFGFNPDARLSDEGFNNVLKLRQEIEGGPPPNPAKYLDLSYYDRALKLVR